MNKKKYIIFFSDIDAFFVKNVVDMKKLNNKLHITHDVEKAKLYATMKAAETEAKKYLVKLPQIMTVEEVIRLSPIALTDVLK